MLRDDIEKLIPHRAPFLWIDGVEELQPGAFCLAWKRIDANSPAFAGHFPSNPVLPGVFLIEAIAQTACVMLASAAQPELDALPLLAAVNRFKFLKPVKPGQELRIVTRKLTEAGKMAYIEGTVSVAGEVVARGELSVVSA
jgi:3-hydroxyacyl-[acyl-carrier-protein] dehydratase